MTLLKRACGLLLALALVLGLQAVAYAQTGAASITGLVTDQSGAATPGVTVTATNQATNVEYTAVSNATGNYDILSVPVGRYVVKAALSGFKVTTTRAMTLEAKQIARVDLRMEVGALEDTVEVTAQAPVLQTETATVGEVLSGRTVESLPLNGRNSSQLALLMPGAITPNPQAQTASGGDSARPFVNGNREQTNNFMVDGIDMNETVDNRIAYQPSPDAIAEISVETNNYAADIGNVAGGVISNVIKSGANQFRGNAFEFYRDSGLDANSWANNRSGAKKAERTQHIFGATLGGPIIKNKLFFFVDYQGTVEDRPGSATASVAPAAWRVGDLSRHHHQGHRPAHRPAVPEQPDPPEPDQPDRPRDPEQPGLPAPEPRSHRRGQQLRGRLARHHARPPGRPPPRLERVGQRQALPPLLDVESREQDRPRRRSRSSSVQSDADAVPQPGGQLEPRLQLVADQRGPRRVQLDQQCTTSSTTGAASATPTPPSGSPAGQPAPRPERDQLGPAGSHRSALRTPSRTTCRRATSSTRS